MKLLILFLLTAACSSSSIGKYKKQYHIEDYNSSMTPAQAHGLLADKMKRCYPQSDYPAYKKTVAKFDDTKESGTITYEVDNQSMGPRPLALVEVVKDGVGSLIKIYAKGDLFRAGTIYKHHVHKWLEGKKVDCDSFGKI